MTRYNICMVINRPVGKMCVAPDVSPKSGVMIALQEHTLCLFAKPMLNTSYYNYYLLNFFQPQYGHLKACVQLLDGTTHCILQFLHLLEQNDEPIHNDRDCPLLLLTELFLCIRSERILTPVSIVHACVDGCKLQRSNKRRRVERQEYTELNCLSLCHDYKNNNIYAVNIYCMKNANYY